MSSGAVFFQRCSRLPSVVVLLLPVDYAAPYGGGRFLSLFRKKIDTLTIQYRDVDGGLHGAIFTMPVGNSELMKTALLAQGAHTAEPSVVPVSSGNSPNK